MAQWFSVPSVNSETWPSGLVCHQLIEGDLAQWFSVPSVNRVRHGPVV